MNYDFWTRGQNKPFHLQDPLLTAVKSLSETKGERETKDAGETEITLS